MKSYLRVSVFFACYLAAAGSCYAQVGNTKAYDASQGGKQDTAMVGDLIKVSIDQSLIGAGTTPTPAVVEGDAIQFVALVKDQTAFVAYFLPQKVGTGKIKFSYTKKDGTTNVLALYSFTVSTPQVGRTLTLKGTILIDTSTGNPLPNNAARVGDIIRVPMQAGVTSLSAGVLGGDSIRVLPEVIEGGVLVLYWSVDKPGNSLSIVYSAGESGFISAPIQVVPR